jgi:hypothetical protein
MNRPITIAAFVAAFVVAACGNGATAANSSSSPSPSRGANLFRNGASGQLVQINGQTLILTSAAGDTTVSYTSTTTITKTSTSTLADIVPGTCIVATGQKDATGMLVATTVRVSPKTSAGCLTVRTGPSPAPGASPRPSPSAQSNVSFVAGAVTAANGISITVLTATAGSVTITVPTTATVSRTSAATTADLLTGECLRATGPKDSAGAVQATSITITPPGPSGTCSTRGGGFPGGGFPGGGFPAGGSPAAG